MAWWAIYYNEVIRPLGGKGAFTHPLGCLLWTAEVCGPAKPVAVHGVSVPAYTPIALWASLVVLILGLFVVWRTPSPQPYPQTPVGEPKLIVGRLEPFYAWVRDLSWPIVRIAVGGTLLVHGINKVMGPTTAAAFGAKSLGGRGLEPGVPLGYLIYFIETGGAVMIILGLFTRLVAPIIAIEMFIIAFVAHFANGYGWTAARGGWEFPLMWGVIFFAIALRGGGPYSLDRALGREL
jgi:putative oxidoreductase